MRSKAFTDPRVAIATAVAQREGETLTAVSRLIGRSARYLDRFVREGMPAQLQPSDRQLLARYLGLDERDLGAPDLTPAARERSLSWDRSKILGDVLPVSFGWGARPRRAASA